jgi:hypothetical protein
MPVAFREVGAVGVMVLMAPPLSSHPGMMGSSREP